MKPRHFIFLGCALLAGGAKGWWTSQDDIITSNDDSDWEALETESLEGSTRLKLSQGIKDSGILLGANTPAKTAALSSEENIPDLPDIIGTSVVNGRAQAHIKMQDGPPVSYSQGETLESGWQLRDVSLKGMVLVYEDKELELLLTEYDMTAPQKKQDTEFDEEGN